MKTEDLIVRLAVDATPVRRLDPIGLRLVRWLAASSVATAIGVWAFHARPDAIARIGSARYLALLGVTILTALVATTQAFASAVPDARRGSVWYLLPLVAAGAWGAMLVSRLLANGSLVAQLVAEPTHAGCVGHIVTLAIVPGVLLLVALRRAAPLDPWTTGGLASLGVLALAAAGSQIICPIDSPAHHFSMHFIATLLLAGLGLVAARPVLGRLIAR